MFGMPCQATKSSFTVIISILCILQITCCDWHIQRRVMGVQPPIESSEFFTVFAQEYCFHSLSPKIYTGNR